MAPFPESVSSVAVSVEPVGVEAVTLPITPAVIPVLRPVVAAAITCEELVSVPVTILDESVSVVAVETFDLDTGVFVALEVFTDVVVEAIVSPLLYTLFSSCVGTA